MIRVFKWWWTWNFEEIENWLEKMEAGGLRLAETRCKGVVFGFEKCKPVRARYCVDYQRKLTPEYMAIINDDGWRLYQMGMGWYMLRKEYEEDRPDLYTDFEALIARNMRLLILILAGLAVEFICIGNLVRNAVKFPSDAAIAETCIFGVIVLAFFTFAITNLVMQISKFKKKC
ncbi:uncharacterized protein DUF2812 [Ruminiclostridium sufflavum DSM 19573]|uniref:Uncharacterized protein DUF2812 n=1 Tax=Ruminiclostridium sufflavum DSM 19573 TaxID=1121337 RepID=A0A318XMN0_9FIRM|nr:DUF2812 domain-containing protein [Ruminiclostridium sufflavum]PYG87819.1 uncharacterized protein DUF2812 [Ruminiclostridium sufflavum DSM 19573]